MWAWSSLAPARGQAPLNRGAVPAMWWRLPSATRDPLRGTASVEELVALNVGLVWGDRVSARHRSDIMRECRRAQVCMSLC